MTPRPQTASATSPHGRTRPSALACLAAATAAALLLAGCTVEVVDRRDTASASDDASSPSSTSTTSGTSAPEDASTTDDAATDGGQTTPDSPETSEGVDPSDDPAASAPDQSPGGPGAHPSPVATPAPPTTTVGCGADGTLDLWQASQAVELTEDCEHVTISAADVQLTAREITTLEIAAAGVVVHVTSVGTVSVAGADNTVTWDEGSPEVSDEGAGNVLVAS